MSAGNMFKLKVDDKNILIFSTFKEKIIPTIIPVIVAKKPIVKPVKKKVFLIKMI